MHKCRSSVNFRGKTFLPEKYVWTRPSMTVWLIPRIHESARITWPLTLTLTLSTPWMHADLESILWKFGGDPAICVREEAICAKVYRQTDRQTDDGRRAIALAHSWNELKINKIPEFYIIFARKMPELYIIVASKKYFPNFWEGARARTCPHPPSPTPMVRVLLYNQDRVHMSWRWIN